LPLPVPLDRGHDYGHISFMATVSKGTLKAKMLEYFRRVEETGEELIVTDNNRPVLRVIPMRSPGNTASLFADVRGRVVYHEDPVAQTADEWPEK
jgi:prevent-host-death family protein